MIGGRSAIAGWMLVCIARSLRRGERASQGPLNSDYKEECQFQPGSLR